MHAGRSISPGSSGPGRSNVSSGIGQVNRFLRPASRMLAMVVSCAICVGTVPLRCASERKRTRRLLSRPSCEGMVPEIGFLPSASV